MGPIFRIKITEEAFYDVHNISDTGLHIYSLQDQKGNYAEIGYNAYTGVWTEIWRQASVPPFDYDLIKIGNLIRKEMGF